MSNFDELRQEFTKSSFRKKMKEELGKICVNCGSSEHIEYHHIVPLVHGGTNNLSNIVPLCTDCHNAAHNKHIHGEGYKKAREEGRVGRNKKTTYEDALPVLEKYFGNEIGLAEAKKMLGLSPKNKSSWYKVANRYREEHNIPKDFYNHIDIQAAKDKRRSSFIRK